jgi:hypothetical protein
VLRAIERNDTRKIRQASDAADAAVRLLAVLKFAAGGPRHARLARPLALADWQNEDHELQRGWRLQNLPLKNDASLEEIAQKSVAILLALACGVDEYPYCHVELDPEYFDPREVHLRSVRHTSKAEWSGMTGGLGAGRGRAAQPIDWAALSSPRSARGVTPAMTRNSLMRCAWS